jgi:8-amino-7-oxononanoate synthase
LDQRLHKKLEDRIEKGTLRSLSSFDGMIDFFSNDYLGLSKEDFSCEISSYGATGSRLISGTTPRMLEIEFEIAQIFAVQSSLMFNSGYDANLGLFSSIPQRGDTILYDEFIHASVRDGIRLSHAKTISFRHNDIEDLSAKIERSDGSIYVAVESLYSMDGDFAPIKKLAVLCKSRNAYLIVDEAHACGVFGENGKGLVFELGLTHLVFARLVTFGKAYGSHGACVLGSSDLIQYLYNFARSFIYTTALPESVFERNLKLASSGVASNRRMKLNSNLVYFRSNFYHSGLISNEMSPIQIIEFGSIEATKMVAEKIQALNIAVKPIYSPTVTEGKERLRICIHSFNTKQELDALIRALR